MSVKHPIIGVTGSSGAGTTTVRTTFSQIFRRERIAATIVEGDAFHRYSREEMRRQLDGAHERGDPHFSHFGPEANLFVELQALFESYARNGSGKVRAYLHDENDAAPYQQVPGTFTPWMDLAPGERSALLRGLARRRGHGQDRRRALRRPAHRGRAVGQSRVDSKTPSRQDAAWSLARGRRRYDSAPNARLRELYLPAVFTNRCELSARSNRRYVEPLRRACDSGRG